MRCLSFMVLFLLANASLHASEIDSLYSLFANQHLLRREQDLQICKDL